VTVQLAGALDAGTAPDAAQQSARWRCALVNNMPDTAFCATERQFAGLLDAGSGCETVALTRHTMAGVPRGESVRDRVAATYRHLEDLRSDPPDLLVITGANPVEPRMEDEPYWSDLCDLLRWGSENVPVMVLSCLSAHVALSVFDGIERTALPAKCTGVFAQQPDPAHPLAAGLGWPVFLPHSRFNAVPVETLVDAGYAMALQSQEVGWSVANKTVGQSEVVLVQAHPEYDASSLVREYVRDLRRYVSHERDELPCLPTDCVTGADWAELRQLHERVVGGERNPDLLAGFAFDEIGARAPWPWRGAALRLFANVLATIPARSA
jgi:homoserine O-succinyltransferase